MLCCHWAIEGILDVVAFEF